MQGELPRTTRRLIDVDSNDGVAPGALDVTTIGDLGPDARAIAAAHPADELGEPTAGLLHAITGRPVICMNVRGVGRSTPEVAPPARAVAAMADDLEAVRRRLDVAPWTFWGMSGGGWIGQAYAARYPVAGLILESTCACFRLRLADPACLLSPFHPQWQPALAAAGLIAPGSHDADAGATEWIGVAGVEVLRRRNGPALLVAPFPLDARMHAVLPALFGFDARGALADLRAPTLVMAGGADPVVPVPHVRALQQGIPGAALVVIDGAGHVPTAQRHPEAVAAVGAFLRR